MSSSSVTMWVCSNTWSRGLLEKLIVSQVVKTFSAFYVTWRLITMFATTRHCFPSLAEWIQSTPSNFSSCTCILILILHSAPMCSKRSLSCRFSHPSTVYVSFFLVSFTCPTHLILLDSITLIRSSGVFKPHSALLCSFLLLPVIFSSYVSPSIFS